MNRRLSVKAFLMLALIGLLGFPLSVFAQDELTQTFVSADGSFMFKYPEGWFAQAEEDGSIVSVSNNEELVTSIDSVAGGNDILVVLFSPAIISVLAPATESPSETLTAFQDVVGATIPGKITETTLGGREAAQADVDLGSGVTATIVVIQFDDGTYGVALLVGNMDEWGETALAVVGTFNNSTASSSTSGGGTTAGKPCTVSTDQPYVSLHVGPGENRGELSAIPVNQDITVLGKATADDGSLWWQVDKDQAAPGTDAAETWVADAAVDKSGDCDQVQDVNAPPIIPMHVAPPPQETGGGQQPPANTSGTGQGLFIYFPSWQSQLPANIRASSASTARYVAYVTPSLTTVGEETYIKWNGELTTVRRQRVDYLVIVYNAATGAEVGRQTFQGSDPPGFPDMMPINATLNGDPPPLDNALGFFYTIVGAAF
jgi:hypothetical protein